MNVIMVSNGSSSSTGQTVFELESQADVMRLLASVRASALSPAEKNELRDLVFLYTNGGHDESVKITLEQKIAAHKILMVEAKKNLKPAPSQPTIGTFRSAPSFRAPAVTEVKVSEEKPTAPVPEPVEVVKETPPQVPEPKAEVPVPPVEPTTTTDASLERIREIKSLVNEKVGNPVHLVDMDPEVGREYMGALLEAMKKLNTGSSAVAAMTRLETAFEAVENLLEKPPATPPQAPASVVHVTDIRAVTDRVRTFRDEANEPPMAEVPTPKPVIEPVAVETPKPSPVVAETPVYAPEPVAEEKPPQSGFAKAAPTSNRVPVRHMEKDVSSASKSVPIKSTPRTNFATEGHQEEDSVRPVSIAGTPATPPNTTPITPLSSLSNPLVKGPKSMEEEVTKKAETGDPLFLTEVDNGLQQLLEEWPLFQKSGLFGTGPKGREHPLFKKIAGLQIPLLLAGRFEGATQEIKQSITDYMNGWRYEQGLIYEQGETFEHYLRRVIRHILDLQRNKI